MISGTVISGDKLGRKLGFPTANLDCNRKDLKLREGVYAAYANVGGQKFKSALVINFSTNKTEVFLLDYDGGDLYGSSIEVEPVQKVGEVEMYEDLDELKEKIKLDLKMVKDVLDRHKT